MKSQAKLLPLAHSIVLSPLGRFQRYGWGQQARHPAACSILSVNDLSSIAQNRKYCLLLCASGSESNSERSGGSTGAESVASRNTLLAIDTRGQHIKRVINNIHDDMRIDSSLFDPDSLWQRSDTKYDHLTYFKWCNRTGDVVTAFWIDIWGIQLLEPLLGTCVGVSNGSRGLCYSIAK